MEPFRLLDEPPGLPAFALPDELARPYGGTLGFERERLFANVVSSLDGVVAVPGLPRSNRLLADSSDADRFLMGLLRACADAVLVGSGTMRGSPRSTWTPEGAFPPAAGAYADLRDRLGLPSRPALALVSAGDGLPVDHPALERGPLVLTTARGAALLHGRLPSAAELVVVPGTDRVDLRAAVAVLRRRGHGRILSEAGPRALGSLVSLGLVDELFLTLSPLLAGRPLAGGRLALLEEVALLPDHRVSASLVGVRSHGAHLFLRYRLETGP